MLPQPAIFPFSVAMFLSMRGMLFLFAAAFCVKLIRSSVFVKFLRRGLRYFFKKVLLGPFGYLYIDNEVQFIPCTFEPFSASSTLVRNSREKRCLQPKTPTGLLE